jgi:hypothetical protein
LLPLALGNRTLTRLTYERNCRTNHPDDQSSQHGGRSDD